MMEVLSSRLGLRQLYTCRLDILRFVCVIPDHGSAAGFDSQTSFQPPDIGIGKVDALRRCGAELTQFEVDSDTVALIKRGSVTLPGTIQYAWPHPSRQYLYVAWSNGELRQYGVTVLRIDPVSAALHPLGKPASLPSRPIHLTTDPAGTHVLVAYNNPSGVTVHRISPDGEIVSQITPRRRWILGSTHIRSGKPGGRTVVLVTRGNGPAGDRPEEPGALKMFDYQDGVLTNRMSIAPQGGSNFQPRHLDFHPTLAWVFVSLERQNKLQVYQKSKDGGLSAAPCSRRTASLNRKTSGRDRWQEPFTCILTASSCTRQTGLAM